MSVVVAEDSSVHQLVRKGALQEILNVPGAPQRRYVPLDDNMLRRVKRVTDTLNRQVTRGRRRDQIPACA